MLHRIISAAIKAANTNTADSSPPTFPSPEIFMA